MEIYHAAINILRLFALAVGSLVIFFGIARGALVARGPGGRARAARRITHHAALGLDFFVGATLLNLAINPTLPAAATTALTIVTRKLLTFSLNLTRRDADAPSTEPRPAGRGPGG